MSSEVHIQRRGLLALITASLLITAAALTTPSAAAAAGDSTTTGTTPPATIATERYAGADRFATAAAVSQHTFADGCDCVAYIAYAFNFADALAGAAAAGTVRGPVLLVATDGPVNPATAAELRRLKPTKIVVLGSTAVVSEAVHDELAGYAPAIERYAGADRFATAADVSSHTFAADCGCVAYIAYAFNFADALAGAAAAGTVKGPVLLADTQGPLNPATIAELQRLKPAKIAVLGSANVVSDATYADLATYAPAIERYAGTDRFGTAAAVSSHTFGADCGCVAYVAYAFDFPDALAAAASAGMVKGPALLVASTAPIDDQTLTELRRVKPQKIVVLGSSAVISDAVMTALSNLDPGNPPPPPAPAPMTRTRNIFASSLVRYQDPDMSACTATAAMLMLNFVSASGTRGAGFTWTPTTAYSAEENVLAWERQHMTMLQSSLGSDPHGWRNALNFYGWGPYTDPDAFHYADIAYGSYDSAVRAAVQAVARYGKPVGLLGWSGRHAQVLHGYEVYGQDPAVSSDFTVTALYITDPLAKDGLVNARITYSSLENGPSTYRFAPYLETDSPYDDPYTPGYAASVNEWYGKWVLLAPVQ